MRIKEVAFSALAGIVVLFSAPQANATVEIILSNNGSTVDVVDGGPGDSCAAANCVTYNGVVGNYSINVSTGTSDSVFPPFLDLNSVDKTATAGNPGTLTIETSDNGYTPKQLGFQFDVGGTQNVPGSVTFSAFGGTSNTKFDMSNPIGTPLTFTTGAYSGSTTSYFAGTSPYSLTIEAALNYTGTGKENVSFDAALSPVPEPASVVLLGGVLLFTASRIRRRKLNRG